MASQIFRFPGFFDREIDLTSTTQSPIGTPAGVVGASELGPAFVPTTVGSFADFQTKFGSLSPTLAAPYAVDKFLNNRTALTFIRILGAGANETDADIELTRTQGTVKSAGFVVSSSFNTDATLPGAVQFLTARHIVTGSEAFGYPLFSNNDSYFTTGSVDKVHLVRGVIFAADGARIQIMGDGDTYSTTMDDIVDADDSREFRIVISSSLGAAFSTDDGTTGIRVLTASLDPASDNYFAKLLNTDPNKFEEEQHYVFADFAVDASLASITTSSADVGLMYGSSNTSAASGDTSLPWQNAFGRFDARYKSPKTPAIISQPYGDTEYDLFHFESLSDGEYGNDKYKISIAAVQKSSNPRSDFGTFTVVVRTFDDTDVEPKIIEQFNNVNLNPASDNFIGRIIGDKHAFYNFDVENVEDRRVIVKGRYPNRSKFIRVVMNSELERGQVPDSALPFGFRGTSILSTNSLLIDSTGSAGLGTLGRLAAAGTPERLDGAIVPPTPFVFKCTRGNISTTGGGLIGSPGPTEIVDSRYYWGVKFGKVGNVLNPNITTQPSSMIASLTQFLGIEKLDVTVTGSGRDTFNNNKFTMARVAFANTAISDLTSSVPNIMREVAYIRNGTPSVSDYTITDNATNRITLATLVQNGTASEFNRFSDFTKFTTIMGGGWDGSNKLDKNARVYNDRASSTESRGAVFGNASVSFVSPGFSSNQSGIGTSNSTVFAYRTAASIITDAITSNVNIVVFPGQREPLVTNYTLDKVRDYGMALYALDIPNYDANLGRVFDGETGVYIDVENTANSFESRALDNFYGAAYFPNTSIDDNYNSLRVVVPATISAIAALGFNDKVAYPWFAPAGFNRASLDFVKNTQTRIKQSERERLYDVKINPIVKFPNEGYVIMAQNTLQLAESALESINVQRMVSDVKRQAVAIGNKIIFEQITPELQTELVKNLSNALSVIQVRKGIERFRVISNNTNNTSADREDNKMNVRIEIVPTRAIEFIAIDFIITRSGVQFAG